MCLIVANVREKLRLRVEKLSKTSAPAQPTGPRAARSTTDLVGRSSRHSEPFFTSIVRGAEDIAYKQGYRLILCQADNDPHKEIRISRPELFRPAGLLVIPSEESDFRKFLKEGKTTSSLSTAAPTHGRATS